MAYAGIRAVLAAGDVLVTVPALLAAPSAVLYYGMDEPASRCAATVKDTDVVLQPYHPVVREGRFEEVFPHCRR